MVKLSRRGQRLLPLYLKGEWVTRHFADGSHYTAVVIECTTQFHTNALCLSRIKLMYADDLTTGNLTIVHKVHGGQISGGPELTSLRDQERMSSHLVDELDDRNLHCGHESANGSSNKRKREIFDEFPLYFVKRPKPNIEPRVSFRLPSAGPNALRVSSVPFTSIADHEAREAKKKLEAAAVATSDTTEPPPRGAVVTTTTRQAAEETAGPKPDRAYGELYLRQAMVQLDVALIMKKNKFWSNCVWQMQQCIELALKGVLIMCKASMSRYEHMTHSLEKLHCATADAGFSMPGSIQRHLPMLQAAYTHARYPEPRLPMENYSENDVAPILWSLCDHKEGILTWLEDQGFLLPRSGKRPAEQPLWLEPAQQRQRCESPTSVSSSPRDPAEYVYMAKAAAAARWASMKKHERQEAVRYQVLLDIRGERHADTGS